MPAKTEQYRAIVERVLSEYVPIRYSNGDITNEAVFDRMRDRYLVVSVGWQGHKRVQHNLLHLDIISGNIWIHEHGTEDGVADALEAAGVPKQDIVLALHSAADRTLIPEYAVA